VFHWTAVYYLTALLQCFPDRETGSDEINETGGCRAASTTPAAVHSTAFS